MIKDERLSLRGSQAALKDDAEIWIDNKYSVIGFQSQRESEEIEMKIKQPGSFYRFVPYVLPKWNKPLELKS